MQLQKMERRQSGGVVEYHIYMDIIVEPPACPSYSSIRIYVVKCSPSLYPASALPHQKFPRPFAFKVLAKCPPSALPRPKFQTSKQADKQTDKKWLTPSWLLFEAGRMPGGTLTCTPHNHRLGPALVRPVVTFPMHAKHALAVALPRDSPSFAD